MTSVGKILVLVVVAMSVVFLGISAVTMSTAKDWKKDIGVQTKSVAELKKKLDDAKGAAELAGKQLDDAKAAFETEKKALDARNAGIQDEIKRDEVQIKSTREQWAAAHENSKGAMAEVAAKRIQIDEIRAKIAAVQKQTQEFKQHQMELTDLIHETERLLGTADQNQSDLKDR